MGGFLFFGGGEYVVRHINVWMIVMLCVGFGYDGF